MKPSIKHKNPFSYILWYSSRGIGCRHIDYHWLTTKYLPALRQAEASARSKAETDIISDGYYLLGDIYDFLGAPQMSIKAYARSLKFAPLNAGSHRELGSFLFDTGNKDKGIRHLRRAVELWPEDDNAKSDLEYALKNPKEQPFMTGPKYETLDLIAMGKGKAALDALKGKRSLEARQMRTYAYATLGMEPEYLKEWEAIAQQRGPVEFAYADWLYITDELWNNSRIWDIWLRMKGRFLPGAFPTPPCFDIYLKLPKHTPGTREPRFDKAVNKRYSLYFLAQSARVNKDAPTLKRLIKKYPLWTDLKDFLRP